MPLLHNLLYLEQSQRVNQLILSLSYFFFLHLHCQVDWNPLKQYSLLTCGCVHVGVCIRDEIIQKHKEGIYRKTTTKYQPGFSHDQEYNFSKPISPKIAPRIKPHKKLSQDGSVSKFSSTVGEILFTINGTSTTVFSSIRTPTVCSASKSTIGSSSSMQSMGT